MTQHDSAGGPGGPGGPDWWSGFEHDPRLPANSDLRAADRDRDHVRDLLTEAFSDGRLDRSEFDERSDAVASARTLGEVTPIVSDLVRVAPTPAMTGKELTSRSIEERAVASWRADRREALWAMLSASAICWVIWLATNGFSGGFPWPLFVMLGTGLNLARTQVMRNDKIAEERARLERKQAKQLRRSEDDEA